MFRHFFSFLAPDELPEFEEPIHFKSIQDNPIQNLQLDSTDQNTERLSIPIQQEPISNSTTDTPILIGLLQREAVKTCFVRVDAEDEGVFAEEENVTNGQRLDNTEKDNRPNREISGLNPVKNGLNPIENGNGEREIDHGPNPDENGSNQMEEEEDLPLPTIVSYHSGKASHPTTRSV